jgi:metal-responsive CopG/Arc/MetJ family transcriptional regulator
MTLDDDLIKSVDTVVRELKTSRSAFTRDALRNAINRFNIGRLEENHRRGYEFHPVKKSGFGVWESERYTKRSIFDQA